MKRYLMAVAGLALLAAPGMARADAIAPGVFAATLALGDSVTIQKTVTIDAGAASTQADILFLSDTTGSMGGTIAAVQAAAASILTATAGLGNVAWGVAEYRDLGDIPEFQINQDVTTTQAAVSAALGTWTAGGGGDTPEAALHALTTSANTASWRAGSQKLILWFGDAEAHDPDNIGGETLASTIAALNGQGAKVIAFDVGNLNGLGQATSIAAATGGSYNAGLGGDPATTVINAITAAFATYSSVCIDTTGAPGVGVSSSPNCYVGAFDRSIQRTFDFDVTFTAVAPGVHVFTTSALVDGGIVASEADTITVAQVPEPATLALFGLGLAGLGLVRRRSAR